MTLVPAESGATCEYRECGMDAVVCDLDTVSDGEVSFYCTEHRPHVSSCGCWSVAGKRTFQCERHIRADQQAFREYVRA